MSGPRPSLDSADAPAATSQEALSAPLSSLPPRCNHGYVLYRLRADVEASLGPGAALRGKHAAALRAAVAAAQAAGLLLAAAFVYLFAVFCLSF